MDAKEDAAERGVVHGIPEAGKLAHGTRADGAWLVGDGDGGIVGVAEVAAEAVELVGDEGEGDGVGGVVGEGEIIACFVVEAGDLEARPSEGGVAGWIFGIGQSENPLL